MNIFDLMKSYQSEWNEVESREFTAEEQKAVESATVVTSNYGKSVCFLLPGGIKKFMALEPVAEANVGDTLDMSAIKIVHLTYNGTNPDQKVKDIFRVRVRKEVVETTMSFDNPFGLPGM